MMDQVILKGSPIEIVSFYQYPLPRHQYCQTVGEVGEHTVAWVFQTIFEEENVVIHSSISANGVDIQIPSLSVGIEVWNWSSNHCYWSRVRDVVRNLSSFRCKILVAAFVSETVRQYFDNQGIFVIELGYQLIPHEFLEWFIVNQSMHKKKVSESRRTRRILFNKIISALLQIGVLSNTYTAHIYDSVPDLSSSSAHVCNTLSDVCNSLSHVSFDSVNADFNMDKSCIVEGKSSEITSLSSENAYRTNHSIDLSEGKNIKVILKETLNLSSDRETQTDYRSLIEKCLKCPYLDRCEVSTLILLDPKQRNPIDNLLDLRQFCLFYNKLSYESCEFFNYDCSTCGVRKQCKEIRQKLDDILHQVLCKYPEFMSKNTWYFKDPYNQRSDFAFHCCGEYCSTLDCKKWNYLRYITKDMPELVYDQHQEIIEDLKSFLEWKIERCIYVKMSKCWETSLSPKVQFDLEELKEVRERAKTFTPEQWQEYFKQILRSDYKTWLQTHSEQSMDSEVI